jgi:hypothetical protein
MAAATITNLLLRARQAMPHVTHRRFASPPPHPSPLRPVQIRRPKLTTFGDFLDSVCYKTYYS